VLGFINIALVQSKYSYNFSLKNPVTLNPGDIINSSTITMTTAKTGARPYCNHAKCVNFDNGSGLKTFHTLVLGSINVALVQSKYSYNFSLKGPVTSNLGDTINDSTMPMTPAKDRSKAALSPCQVCEILLMA
jgi:hypothetical protein